MKKLVLCLMLIVFNVTLFAQKEVFTINEYGTCEVVRELKGTDAQDCYKKLKAWLGQCNMTWISTSDVVNEKLDFNANFNATRSYNPFAGWFQTDLIFDGHIVIDGATAVLTLTNFRVREIYAGFGAKNEETAIEEKIKALDAANNIIQNGPDPSLSKKEQKKVKKEAKDNIEDLENTLNKSGEELSQRLEKLNSIF